MRILPICILALWLSLACNSSTSLGKTTLASNEVNSTASVMYHNGDIVTMEGDSAAYVEAVVVKVGKILYAGAKDESMKQAGEGHQMVDLHGKLMSPGFLDVHGHAFYVGFQKMAGNILPPPDGPVNDIETLIKTLQQWYVDLEKQGKTPNGVLEEIAGDIVMMKLFSKFDSTMSIQMAKAGLQAYKEFGFTTVLEGAAAPNIVEVWRSPAASGELDVDVAACTVLVELKDMMGKSGTSATYDRHFRIAGVKITQDVSPQGKAAYLSKPYKVTPAGQPKSYRGYPGFPRQTQLDSLVEYSFSKYWQVLMHCNGDAAGDMMTRSARRATEKLGAKDRRPEMIHAQTARYDQLDSLKNLGIIPSFFSMHTFCWVDWHRDETLGPKRAVSISPAQIAYMKCLLFIEHHDAPVGLPSSIMIMHTAVNRTSRINAVIGEAEKLTPYQVLLFITRYSAYQYFEKGTKGMITACKLADLAILNRNPMKIDPKEIINNKVMETISAGKST